ncbi:MAG: ATP-binding protein [Spirochaetia bacterium]|jgi:AAA15 family ATPase/GTPase|nr:ATP-binding protein [Spirochaetia bacterium]
MLLQFRFKNFKSFQEEAVLDMTATGISELSNHVVNLGKGKILPVCSIFGANASGKSNVQQAFEYMTDLVLNSFAFGDSKENDVERQHDSFPVPPVFVFCSDKDKCRESEFEVFYVDHKSCKTINYGFSVDDEGVIEEWLIETTKGGRSKHEIISRDRKENVLDLDEKFIPKEQIANLKASLEKETLVVSLGAKLKVRKCKDVRDWFLGNEIIDYGDSEENFFRSRLLPRNFDTKEVQDQVVAFLSTFDESIKGFKVEKHPSKTRKNAVNYHVFSLHEAVDSKELIPIELSDESSGTLKMFSLYVPMIKILQSGGILFVDELNAKLHPLLVRNIVLTFANEETNPNHAQLLFSTHDTWYLSNNLFRRDEIWFTDKDEKGRSTLYSLAEFKCNGEKIRKDEQYQKNYLLGKYHAIPTIKTMRLIFPDLADDEG